jgi:hypothetical protein
MLRRAARGRKPRKSHFTVIRAARVAGIAARVKCVTAG